MSSQQGALILMGSLIFMVASAAMRNIPVAIVSTIFTVIGMIVFIVGDAQ